LAGQLGAARVGLIPYTINPLTTGVSPLKTYEYLASGLAVVSTPLPSIGVDDGDVFVRSTPSEFARTAIALLDDCTTDAVVRRAAAAHGGGIRDEDWRVTILRGTLAKAVIRGLRGWEPEVVHAPFINRPATVALEVASHFCVPCTIMVHAKDWAVDCSPSVLR